MADSKKSEQRLAVPYAQIELKDGTRVHLQAGDVVPSEASADSVKNLNDLGFLSDEPFLSDNT